ncbi:MAG: DUF3035 domain-containing protein [Alphaproteobacteria bacterium]
MNCLRISVPVTVAAALIVVGCGNVKQTLGISKRAPDEFSVVTRAPLTMPPDYGLRPPRPGERRPQEPLLRHQARDVLVSQGGGDLASAAHGGPGAGRGITPGDSALLARAGGDAAPGDIRRQVDMETARLDADDRNLIERMMFWREPPPPGQVVDAEREARRIQENTALGRPPVDGETPTIERRTVVRNRIF